MEKSNLEKFSFLFSGDIRKDALTVCEYVDEFYGYCQVQSAEIDLARMMQVTSSMVQDFPVDLPVDKSSPFKKAAAFTAQFVASKPILTNLPEDQFETLHGLPNAILAVELSFDALFGASLEREDKTVNLEKRIEVSDHFWKDMVLAVSGCIPSQHFKCLALLYESLAYQVNKDASYSLK